MWKGVFGCQHDPTLEEVQCRHWAGAIAKSLTRADGLQEEDNN